MPGRFLPCCAHRQSLSRAAPGGQEVPIFPVCQRGLSHSSAHAQSPLERGVDSGHGSATPGGGDTGRGLGPQGPGGEPPGMSPLPPSWAPPPALDHQADRSSTSPGLLPSWPPLSCVRGPGPGARASLSDPQSPPCEMRWSFDRNAMIFIPFSLQIRAEPFLPTAYHPDAFSMELEGAGGSTPLPVPEPQGRGHLSRRWREGEPLETVRKAI